MSKTFTAADVAAHKTPQDLYIIVDGDVFDLTKFQDDHPGIVSPVPVILPFPRSLPAALVARAPAARESSAPHQN